MLLSVSLWCSGVPSNSVQTPRPADVTMNDEAGYGGLLIVTVRSESGEELSMVLDTGCPETGFDGSMAPKLGNSIGTETFWNFGVAHPSPLYAPPRLYLRGVQLQMSSTNVGIYDCRGVSAFVGRPIMGILGMDVLKHYCVQLDFKARKVRFLDDEHSNKQEWGEPFALADAGDECFFTSDNLSGAKGAGSLIDTGSLHDGWLSSELYQQWTNVALPPSSGACRCPNGVLGGQTYPEIDLERIDSGGHGSHRKLNGIGIQFLSLHLVTFDFPRKTMYLKRTTESSGYTSAVWFLKHLRESGKLPGWTNNEELSPRQALLHFHYPDSATFDAQKSGNPTNYHYSISRASEESAWKLEKAWRTDPSGKTVEEYPVP